MKIAFLFPGQGSQYVGMGKEIYDNWDKAKELYDEANDVLGIDLKTMCFEGPEEELVKTFNTQPALLATSIVCLELLKDKGIVPDYVAGHSLGEYSALVAAGALSFADALTLVRNRGMYMQEAAPQGTAGMAAIIGLDNQVVEDVCNQAKEHGVVEPANYNCPGQIVVSGEVQAVEKAMELAKEAGAKLVVKLNVSGPFHSSLMQPVGEKLAANFMDIKVKDPVVPVVANVTANYVSTGNEIKDLLIRQVSSSVLWTDTIEKLLADGVDLFIEVGPGKVLSGLVKKVNRKARVLNVEDFTSFEKTLAKIEEVS